MSGRGVNKWYHLRLIKVCFYFRDPGAGGDSDITKCAIDNGENRVERLVFFFLQPSEGDEVCVRIRIHGVSSSYLSCEDEYFDSISVPCASAFQSTLSKGERSLPRVFVHSDPSTSDSELYMSTCPLLSLFCSFLLVEAEIFYVLIWIL